jgi:hypothetical protein
MPSFFSLYTLSFPFKEEDLEMLNDVKVVMIEEEKIKICSDAVYGVLKSEIKENETRKDYNTLTDPAKAEIKSVFFCRRNRFLKVEEESLSTFNGF